MKRDYKYLLHPTKKLRVSTPGRFRFPGNLSVLAISVSAALLVAAISLAPEQAGARRANSITEALELPTTTGMEHTEALEATPSDTVDINEPALPEALTTPKKYRTVTVKSGDSLARIFSREGISAKTLHHMMRAQGEVKRLKKLHPGDTLKIALDANNELSELVYKISSTETLRISHADEKFNVTLETRDLEARTAHSSGVITGSFYAAGREAGLSDRMIMELANLFGWDIDFALDIREGDRFAVVYEEKYLDGQKLRDGDILAAEFINRGKVFRAVRYEHDDLNALYYTPEGRNLKRAFLRTPVEFARISSRFNLRRKHPILNRIRAHRGVDYAAPSGTPIRATGDGKIAFRGWKGGYGRTVIIRHGQGYSTLYAHMSKFNGRAKLGAKVQQGQIIGYVGSSGLASGPHLHYEFRMNGVHRNPLTVKLPQSLPIPKKYMDAFQETTEPLLVQLDVVTRNVLAQN